MPSIEYCERRRLPYKDFKRHYGDFIDVFKEEYANQDVVKIGEKLIETIFIFNNFEEELEEEDDLNPGCGVDSEQLGETLFARVGHETRSRRTRPPERYNDEE